MLEMQPLERLSAARENFSTYLDTYRDKLKNIFRGRADADQLALQRGLPPFALREIRSCDPLAVFIPAEYGGRGGHVHECLSMLEASSYESLALSLTFGINGALFLQPVTKYAQEAAKQPIFDRFLSGKNMGGLMITEPDYGSDALSMQTAYTDEGAHYHLQGVKHWGGLTGWADYWLVTARRRDENGNLARDIDFFICDANDPKQRIEVEELYQNLGLYMIPYGRNRIDVQVPHENRLVPRSTGIKMMLDTLHRSRIEFPGMGMGFLRRMLDEGLTHCKERFVGGSSLFSYDQVKERLARLQAAFTACSAMCLFSSEHAHTDNDLSKHGLSANAVKSVLTDLMQDASQSLLQLTGAKGYRLDHIAGRATVDSRPFQIFEGSNDILYQQISESVLKSMRRFKEANLYQYLKRDVHTAKAADYFKDLLDFEVDMKLPQRKLVELGQMLGRVITVDMTIGLGERGFRADLVASCMQSLRQEVAAHLTAFQRNHTFSISDDYQEGSAWLHYVSPA